MRTSSSALPKMNYLDKLMLGGFACVIAVAIVILGAFLAYAGNPDESDVSNDTVPIAALDDATFNAQTSDGANIMLSGMLPQDASVEAHPVDVVLEGITVLAAYDITIYDADGNEFQPEEGTIHVSIENDVVHQAIEEDVRLTIYHLEDEASEPEEVAITEAAGNTIEFDAECFSIYVIGEDFQLCETDGETPHYIYTLNFYLGDTDEPTLLSTQTVSPGEKVEMPSVPDQEHYRFDGWYSEPNGGGEKYDFYNDALSDITDEQDHEINLYAHYTELYYVHYMTHKHEEGEGDTKVIFHTEEYSLGQVLDTTNAEALYLAEGYLSYWDESSGALITALAVTGWLDVQGNEWKTGDVIDWDEVEGGLELYPVVEAAYWVYYDMNGRDGVENPAPEYVLASEETIGDLPEPEVSGYTLDGWYTSAVDGSLVESTTALAELPKNDDGSITLYAHWSESEVAYTINIWRQKAIDGARGINSKEIQNGETYDDYIQYYDYAESHYITPEKSKLKTGEVPTTTKVEGWNTYTGYATTTNTSSAYYGFEYSVATGLWGNTTTSATRTLNDLATKTMAADGSTIINIFYNRVTVTWTFKASTDWSGSYGENGTLIGLYDTSTFQDHDNVAGTFSDWPDPGNGRIWKSSTTSDNATFRARFNLDNNQTNVTFSNTSFTVGHYLYYYLEVTNEALQVDESGAKAQEAAANGVAYTRTVNSRLYVYGHKSGINGFNTFNFTDKYPGYELVGYIDSRNGASQTTYTSSSSGKSHQFDYDGYIFNNALKHTITLISNDNVVGVDGAGNAVEAKDDTTYTVKYGEDLSNYPFPEDMDAAIWGPTYYCHFVGWYADPTLTAPFSTSTMPNYNLVAYADWKLNDITVSFVTGTSEVDAPDDQEIKATQTATDPGTLEREGYTHVGWVDQNGKVFNFDTALYADTTLTAIWKADDESGYLLDYNLNVDNSRGLLDGYDGQTVCTNPEHFTVNEDLWTLETAFEDLVGQSDITGKFIGWNTAADGSGTMYYPGDNFTLDDASLINDGVVILYAIWAHENESTLVLVHNYPSGYDEGTDDNIITQSNLTDIDVAGESGMNYHQEIQVTDANGAVHTYRFDGWSTSSDAATDADVDVAADATVKVDTLYTNSENVNYLYAVWLEVHEITVTKEVINDAINYTVPDDQTFEFNWSFVDGEGETITNAENIAVSDGGSFTIPDVADGEAVTITETAVDDFTTSYDGAHTDVVDDGEGTCTFTMDENSQRITVYNTLNTTTTLYIEKVWVDDNADHRTDTVEIAVREDGKVVGDGLTLREANNWAGSVEVVYDDSKEYTVEEATVPPDYEALVTGNIEDGFTVTNTYAPKPEGEETTTGGGESGDDGSGDTDSGGNNGDASTSSNTGGSDESNSNGEGGFGDNVSSTGAQTGDNLTNAVALAVVVAVLAALAAIVCVKHRSSNKNVHMRS